MATAVRRRRHTPAQRIATLFGGVILVALLILGLVWFIQSSTRTSTDSVMQRVISAPVAKHMFIADLARMEDGTVYVRGHFSGVPQEIPEDDAGWTEMATAVAQEYARALKGVADAVHVSYYHKGELVAEVTESVQ